MSNIAEVTARLRQERALGDAAGQETIPVAAAATAASPAAIYPKDVYGRTPGPYSMLSVCEAAAVYLASAGGPKTSREIADALRAGGIRTTSKNFTDTVRKMLRRSGGSIGFIL